MAARGLGILLLILLSGRAIAAPPFDWAHQSLYHQETRQKVRLPPVTFSAGLYSGASFDIPQVSTAGLVGVTITSLIWQRLELEVSARYLGARYRDQIDVTALIGVRFHFGRLALDPGMALGVSSFRQHINPYQPTWVVALLARPRVLASLRLGRRLEVRLELITLSAYHNEITVLAWEPTCGLAYWF